MNNEELEKLSREELIQLLLEKNKEMAEIEQELRAAMEADQNPDRTDPDEEDAGDE